MNSQREQFFDLFQRESEHLRVTDKPQTPERVFRKDTVACDRSRRALQEPPPLVVSDRLAIHVSVVRIGDELLELGDR
jgi:hypothetical protein